MTSISAFVQVVGTEIWQAKIYALSFLEAGQSINDFKDFNPFIGKNQKIIAGLEILLKYSKLHKTYYDFIIL